MAATRDRIAAAFAERLKAIKGPEVFREGWPRYTRIPSQNLIPGVTEADFVADLRAGDGGELVESADRPAKFCAAYSSAALAVNSFAPLRRDPARLVLGGVSGFSESRFEGKCENGLNGKNPNMDFLASGTAPVLGTESKCLELFGNKPAVFSDQYQNAMSKYADPKWASA